MAALLAELVAIPTENPPGKNYRACADLLESRLGEFGLDCERVSAADSNQRSRRRSSLSTRHLWAWRAHALFSRALRCGSGAIAGTVSARAQRTFLVWPRLLRHERRNRGNAVCHSRPERNGRGIEWPDRLDAGSQRRDGRRRRLGVAGAAGFAGPRAASACFSRSPRAAWCGTRTAARFRCAWRYSGKSAHVGLQHQGENAFERMHRVVERLQQLKHEVEQRTTRCSIGAEQARNSILMLGGQSGGGANFNVVPEKCWFTIDRRINPEEDLAVEKAKLLEVLEELQARRHSAGMGNPAGGQRLFVPRRRCAWLSLIRKRSGGNGRCSAL